MHSVDCGSAWLCTDLQCWASIAWQRSVDCLAWQHTSAHLLDCGSLHVICGAAADLHNLGTAIVAVSSSDIIVSLAPFSYSVGMLAILSDGALSLLLGAYYA
jgi:hypothetical protein